jgi:uncharacterized membrane protein
MNDPRNRYAPPTTHVADQEERLDRGDGGQFIPYGRSLPPGRGVGWIGDAWRLLRARPGMWAAALILLFVAYLVLSIIPFVNLFLQLLVPFVYAGIAMAAEQQRRTGTFELSALTAGFNKQPASLLAIGGVTLLAGIVFVIVLGIFIGAQVFGMMMSGAKPDPSMFLNGRFMLAFLIGIVLMLPIAFATYLAPQLVILQDQPALTAMKMSLIGCAKNIVPGIVFLICSILLMLVSMIPLFLGLLITIPIMVITNYTVYRDIFVEENA